MLNISETVRDTVKPNAQRKTELNWTRLNCSVQFSFPLCVEPATIRDDSATKLAVVVGSSQSGHTLGQSMQCLSLDENRRRAATTGDGRRRFLTVNNLRRPSPVIATRRRFSSQRSMTRSSAWPLCDNRASCIPCNGSPEFIDASETLYCWDLCLQHSMHELRVVLRGVSTDRSMVHKTSGTVRPVNGTWMHSVDTDL